MAEKNGDRKMKQESTSGRAELGVLERTLVGDVYFKAAVRCLLSHTLDMGRKWAAL